MQKSGIKFLNIMPITIVPLDSAVVFLLYATYYTAYSHFRQGIFYRQVNEKVYHTKKPPIGGFLLVHCCCGQFFTTTCATAIQNIATTCSCHSGTKTMRTHATCLGWLICTFCCHDLFPCLFFLSFFISIAFEQHHEHA